jgi:hypothetical protein
VSRGGAVSAKLAASAGLNRIWEHTMPIDLSQVNWVYVAILSGFVFVAALLGGIIAFRNKIAAAFIAAVLFAAVFVFWTHYPRDSFPDVLKTLPSTPK